MCAGVVTCTCSLLLRIENGGHLVECFPTPLQQLQLKEYFMKLIPRCVYTCKVCPSTKVSLWRRLVQSSSCVKPFLQPNYIFLIIIIPLSGWFLSIFLPFLCCTYMYLSPPFFLLFPPCRSFLMKRSISLCWMMDTSSQWPFLPHTEKC